MTPVLIIDIAGVAVGLISIFMMMGVKKYVGGKIGATANLVMIGITLNTAAFIWTITFTRLKLLPPPPLDIHHILMTLGMVLFVLAARKFTSLVRP